MYILYGTAEPLPGTITKSEPGVLTVKLSDWASGVAGSRVNVELTYTCRHSQFNLCYVERAGVLRAQALVRSIKYWLVALMVAATYRHFGAAADNTGCIVPIPVLKARLQPATGAGLCSSHYKATI